MRTVLIALCVAMLSFSAANGQTNLVTNGDFSAPLAPEWIVGNWGTGNSTYGITNGVFHLTVTSIGAAAWNVFFYHFEDITLQAGVNYVYSFTSRATAASLIWTQVKTVGQPPAAAVYMSDSVVSIGTTDSTYSFPFSVLMDDDSGQVNWQLGFGNVPLGATIYISNVSIVASTTGSVARKSVLATAPFLGVRGSIATIDLVNPAKAEMKVFSLRGVLIADYSPMLKAMTNGLHQVNLGERSFANGTYLLATNNGSRALSSTVTIVK